MFKRTIRNFVTATVMLLSFSAYATEHCEFSNGTFAVPSTVQFFDFYNLGQPEGGFADPNGNRVCRYLSVVWNPAVEYVATVLPHLGPGYSDRFFVMDIGDDNGATSTSKAVYVVRRYTFESSAAEGELNFDFVVEQIGTQRKMRIRRSIGSPIGTTMDTLRLDADVQLTLDYVTFANSNRLQLTVRDAAGTELGVYSTVVPTDARLVRISQGRIATAGTMSGNGSIEIWNY